LGDADLSSEPGVNHGVELSPHLFVYYVAVVFMLGLSLGSALAALRDVGGRADATANAVLAGL